MSTKCSPFFDAHAVGDAASAAAWVEECLGNNIRPLVEVLCSCVKGNDEGAVDFLLHTLSVDEQWYLAEAMANLKCAAYLPFVLERLPVPEDVVSFHWLRRMLCDAVAEDDMAVFGALMGKLNGAEEDPTTYPRATMFIGHALERKYDTRLSAVRDMCIGQALEWAVRFDRPAMFTVLVHHARRGDMVTLQAAVERRKHHYIEPLVRMMRPDEVAEVCARALDKPGTKKMVLRMLEVCPQAVHGESFLYMDPPQKQWLETQLAKQQKQTIRSELPTTRARQGKRRM